MACNLSRKNYLFLIEIIFLYLITNGILFAIYKYYNCRSLWADEATFAQTILTRDFVGIMHGNFDYGQSGPLGFVLISKLCTIVFGHNEYALRLPSLFAYLCTIPLIYTICKNAFAVNRPILSVVFITCINAFIYYSSEFKPYSFDVMFTFLSIFTYHLFTKKKISAWTAFLLFSIYVWFSFGNLFIMGGICVFHLIKLIKQTINEKKFVFSDFCPLIQVLISLLIYYFFWVKPTSQNVQQEANEYWRFLSFPLIPCSISDFKLLYLMFNDLFLHTLGTKVTIIVMLSSLITMAVKRNHWITISFIITILLVVIASSLGLFPITLRLQLFIVAVFLLYSAVGITIFLQKMPCNKVMIVASFLFIICPICLLSAHNFFNRKKLYVYGEESKSCLNYYIQNREDSSYLYVSAVAQPATSFYFNYPIVFKEKEHKIITKDNVIWGSVYARMENKEPYKYNYLKNDHELLLNIQAIISKENVYILRSHDQGIVFDWLIDSLKNYGKVEDVYKFEGTILHKYTKNTK